MLAKHKPVRLKGKALRDLVAAVYERDQHSCVVCCRWVEDGHKPHHEPPGYGRKSDELSKMVLLCDNCHYKRHHSKDGAAIRDKIERYLRWMNDEI